MNPRSLTILVWVTFAVRTVPGSTLEVTHAFHRLADESDTGMTSVFLFNPGNTATTVSELRVNDSPVPREAFDNQQLWNTLWPNPVPPKGQSVLRFKWPSRTRRPINVRFYTSDGQELKSIVQPRNPPLRIVGIGFSRDLANVVVHARAEGLPHLDQIRCWVNGRKTTVTKVLWPEDAVSSPDVPSSVGTRSTYCINTALDEALELGVAAFVRIEAVAGPQTVRAEECAKALNAFPILAENGKGYTELGIKPSNVRNYFEGLAALDAHASLRGPDFIRLLTCPMHRHGGYRQAAGEIARRARVGRHRAPRAFLLTHLCKAKQKEGAFVFGPMTDAVITNIVESPPQPRPEGAVKPQHPSQVLAAAYTAAMSPRPWFALAPLVADTRILHLRDRPPTADEFRATAFYALSRGAAGVIYRGANKIDSLASPFLAAAVRQLNAELRATGPLLTTARTITDGWCDDKNVEVKVFWGPPDACLILAINHDWLFDVKSGGLRRVRFDGKKNLSARFRVPADLFVVRIEAIHGSGSRDVVFETRDHGAVTFKIPNLEVGGFYRAALKESLSPPRNIERATEP